MQLSHHHLLSSPPPCTTKKVPRARVSFRHLYTTVSPDDETQSPCDIQSSRISSVRVKGQMCILIPLCPPLKSPNLWSAASLSSQLYSVRTFFLFANLLLSVCLFRGSGLTLYPPSNERPSCCCFLLPLIVQSSLPLLFSFLSHSWHLQHY